jgi:hypothetical protein
MVASHWIAFMRALEGSDPVQNLSRKQFFHIHNLRSALVSRCSWLDFVTLVVRGALFTSLWKTEPFKTTCGVSETIFSMTGIEKARRQKAAADRHGC